MDEEDGKIIFLSIYPVNVSEKIRLQMSELIVRLNYVLFFGSFEMNFEDGEIRFKTSIIYADSKPTEQMIENIIQTNITTMNTHFELFNSFITEKTTIIEVTKKIQDIGIY